MALNKLSSAKEGICTDDCNIGHVHSCHGRETQQCAQSHPDWHGSQHTEEKERETHALEMANRTICQESQGTLRSSEHYGQTTSNIVPSLLQARLGSMRPYKGFHQSQSLWAVGREEPKGEEWSVTCWGLGQTHTWTPPKWWRWEWREMETLWGPRNGRRCRIFRRVLDFRKLRHSRAEELAWRKIKVQLETC